MVVAVRVVVVVAVAVAVCVRVSFLLALKKRSRVCRQNAPVCAVKTPVSLVTRAFLTAHTGAV